MGRYLAINVDSITTSFLGALQLYVDINMRKLHVPYLFPFKGGEHVFALLIAGGGKGEDVFISDVRKVHNCLSDPRVIGIR